VPRSRGRRREEAAAPLAVALVSPYFFADGKEKRWWKGAAVATATMTSKGQLTVPKEIRDRLGLVPGDRVEFVPGDGEDRVVMRKRRTLSLEEIMGSLPTNGISRTLEEMEEDLGRAVVESVMRR
jgi:AbrB family looped-hinge helix DNA binding protein